jgi:hypothetical protein
MAGFNSQGIRTRTDGERDGILFWIIPPLLLGAVFAFCAMANSNASADAESAPAAERGE